MEKGEITNFKHESKDQFVCIPFIEYFLKRSMNTDHRTYYLELVDEKVITVMFPFHHWHPVVLLFVHALNYYGQTFDLILPLVGHQRIPVLQLPPILKESIGKKTK